MRLLLYKLLMRSRMAQVQRVEGVLKGTNKRGEIEVLQIENFNRIWKNAVEHIPFYKAWQKKHNLPDKIERLNELESWPILTKTDLRDEKRFIRDNIAQPKGFIMTGGSTGEPVRLHSWGDYWSGVSQVIGRMAYGIQPGDRTFLLWGHEHLYGTGFKRKINAFKRRLKDWLANWVRMSAYDLGAKAMRRAYKVFAEFKPKFVIGFSPAVLAFVRQNRDKKGAIDSVRVILCTAGPLTPEEKKEIECFFGGTVCMEYGSVECGVMAYTRPQDGRYNVFWNTHLVQAQRQPDGEFKNLVTRLTDCYVPLIRYDIGDYLDLDAELEEENARSVLEIRSVKGRPSEMINFKCGVSFFGALIGDCVKQVQEVVSSQIAVDENNDNLEIRVTSDVVLTTSQLSLVKNRFYLTVENAEKLNVKVVQVDKLYTTVGGKVSRVVRM